MLVEVFEKVNFDFEEINNGFCCIIIEFVDGDFKLEEIVVIFSSMEVFINRIFIEFNEERFLIFSKENVSSG